MFDMTSAAPLITRRALMRQAAILAAAACCLAACASASGQIVLDQDFDSGSLNVPGSTIDYSNPSSPLVTLALRNTIRRVHPRTYFSATGVEGLTPDFRVTSQGQPDGHRHVFSYDQENWHFMDNGYVSGEWANFSHNTPFTQDTVYIAHVLPHPMGRIDAFVNSIKSSPWVSPTASGDANLVVGRTYGTAGGGYYDDAGRVVPAENLYGFQVTDPSVSWPKTKVVINGGNHPAENTGSYAVEGLIDFLISNDPDAARLRRYADFYIYPQCNPEGRRAGYHRSNPEHPERDHNRYWNQPTLVSDIQTIQTAMRADTGGDTDYFFDFHSFGSATQIGQLWTLSELFDSPLANAVLDIEPEITLVEWMRDDAATGWAMAAAPTGLDAEYSYVPEIGVVAGVLADRDLEVGENYGHALHDAIVPDPGVLGDMNDSGEVNGNDINPFVMAFIDPETYYATYGLDMHLVGDVDGSGTFNGNDINPFVELLLPGSPAVPEPATVGIMMLGACLLPITSRLRKRR